MKKFTEAWEAFTDALTPKLQAEIEGISVKRTAVLPIDGRRPISDVVPFAHVLCAPELNGLESAKGAPALEAVQILVCVAVPAPTQDDYGVAVVEQMQAVRELVWQAAQEISVGVDRAWQASGRARIELYGLTEDGSAYLTFFLITGQCRV